MTEISTTTSTGPIIDENGALQTYFQSFESRIGYRLVLGGTRHHGYWEKDTWCMLPVSRALRRMEAKMLERLDLPTGSRVLDAGCGVCHVALYMANHGLQMTGIDVVDHHLERARQNIATSRCLKNNISVEKMDYHHLETLKSDSFDGVYTMETLVHATDAERVLKSFYRILSPGGHIVLHEYEHDVVSEETLSSDFVRAMNQISQFAALPTWEKANHGYFKQLLEDVGFVEVQVEDYSENVRPMLRLFWMMALIPNFFVQLFGLQKYFVNTVAGAYAYNGQKYWRYVSVSARKPDGEETK